MVVHAAAQRTMGDNGSAFYFRLGVIHREELVFILHQKKKTVESVGSCASCDMTVFCDEGSLKVAGLIQLPTLLPSVVGVWHQNPVISHEGQLSPRVKAGSLLTGLGAQSQ